MTAQTFSSSSFPSVPLPASPSACPSASGPAPPMPRGLPSRLPPGRRPRFPRLHLRLRLRQSPLCPRAFLCQPGQRNRPVPPRSPLPPGDPPPSALPPSADASNSTTRAISRGEAFLDEHQPRHPQQSHQPFASWATPTPWPSSPTSRFAARARPAPRRIRTWAIWATPPPSTSSIPSPILTTIRPRTAWLKTPPSTSRRWFARPPSIPIPRRTSFCHHPRGSTTSPARGTAAPPASARAAPAPTFLDPQGIQAAINAGDIQKYQTAVTAALQNPNPVVRGFAGQSINRLAPSQLKDALIDFVLKNGDGDALGGLLMGYELSPRRGCFHPRTPPHRSQHGGARGLAR